ncbi:MAG: bifunctional heptose 7-phosphate kinase/heptose 1-phosphate adenyltransferase [Promethearchaeota archaeon]
MTIAEQILNWKEKKVLVIGDALIDKYIFGHADKISPDAPVPNVRIEDTNVYIGATGLVVKFIKSLGGIPKVCTIIGDDFEGNFYLKNIKELNVDTSGILLNENIHTPQITRIKAMNQHLLRLETDYNNRVSEDITEKFQDLILNHSHDVESILVLDYGLEGIFNDQFIQKLLNSLKNNCKNIPIIARPTRTNFYLYENIDLIKMNLQKALDTFSIDCCNETSIQIAGKRILNSSKCKNLLLNYLELDSYLFSRETQQVIKFNPILKQPVTSYVAVGSVVMAALALSFASEIPLTEAVNIALFAAALTATLPPVNFYNVEKLYDYIENKLKLT